MIALMQTSQKAFYLNSRIGRKHWANFWALNLTTIYVETFGSFDLPGSFVPYYITTQQRNWTIWKYRAVG